MQKILNILSGDAKKQQQQPQPPTSPPSRAAPKLNNSDQDTSFPISTTSVRRSLSYHAPSSSNSAQIGVSASYSSTLPSRRLLREQRQRRHSSESPLENGGNSESSFPVVPSASVNGGVKGKGSRSCDDLLVHRDTTTTTTTTTSKTVKFILPLKPAAAPSQHHHQFFGAPPGPPYQLHLLPGVPGNQAVPAGGLLAICHCPYYGARGGGAAAAAAHCYPSSYFTAFYNYHHQQQQQQQQVPRPVLTLGNGVKMPSSVNGALDTSGEEEEEEEDEEDEGPGEGKGPFPTQRLHFGFRRFSILLHDVSSFPPLFLC